MQGDANMSAKFGKPFPTLTFLVSKLWPSLIGVVFCRVAKKASSLSSALNHR